MTSRIHCDGCGDVVIVEEALYFEVNFCARKAGGGGVLPDGAINVDWDHEETSGDLCSECAEAPIDVINQILHD